MNKTDISQEAKKINDLLTSPPNVLGKNNKSGQMFIKEAKNVTPHQIFVLHRKLDTFQKTLEHNAKIQKAKHISPKMELYMTNKVLHQLGVPDPVLADMISSSSDVPPEWQPKDPEPDKSEKILNDIISKTRWSISQTPRRLDELCYFIPIGPHTSRNLSWEIFHIPIPYDPDGKLWCFHIDDLFPYILKFKDKKIPFPGRDYIQNHLLIQDHIPEFIDPHFIKLIHEWHVQVTILRRLLDTHLTPRSLAYIQRFSDHLHLDKHLTEMFAQPDIPETAVSKEWNLYITKAQRQAVLDSIYSVLQYVNTIAWYISLIRYASCAISLALFVVQTISSPTDVFELIAFGAMYIIGNWLRSIVTSIHQFIDKGFHGAFKILHHIKHLPTSQMILRFFPLFGFLSAITGENATEYFNADFIATVTAADKGIASLFDQTEHGLKFGWSILQKSDNWSYAFACVYQTCTSMIFNTITSNHHPLLGRLTTRVNDWLFEYICSFIQKLLGFFTSHQYSCPDIRNIVSSIMGAQNILLMLQDIRNNIMFNISFYGQRESIGEAIRLRKMFNDDKRLQGQDCVSQFYQSFGQTVFEVQHDPSLHAFDQTLREVALNNPPKGHITNEWLRKTLQTTYHALNHENQLDTLNKTSLGQGIFKLMTTQYYTKDSIVDPILRDAIVFSSFSLKQRMLEVQSQVKREKDETYEQWMQVVKYKAMHDVLFKHDHDIGLGERPGDIVTHVISPAKKVAPDPLIYTQANLEYHSVLDRLFPNPTLQRLIRDGIPLTPEILRSIETWEENQKIIKAKGWGHLPLRDQINNLVQYRIEELNAEKPQNPVNQIGGNTDQANPTGPNTDPKYPTGPNPNPTGPNPNPKPTPGELAAISAAGVASSLFAKEDPPVQQISANQYTGNSSIPQIVVTLPQGHQNSTNATLHSGGNKGGSKNPPLVTPVRGVKKYPKAPLQHTNATLHDHGSPGNKGGSKNPPLVTPVRGVKKYPKAHSKHTNTTLHDHGSPTHDDIDGDENNLYPVVVPTNTIKHRIVTGVSVTKMENPTQLIIGGEVLDIRELEGVLKLNLEVYYSYRLDQQIEYWGLLIETLKKNFLSLSDEQIRIVASILQAYHEVDRGQALEQSSYLDSLVPTGSTHIIDYGIQKEQVHHKVTAHLKTDTRELCINGKCTKIDDMKLAQSTLKLFGTIKTFERIRDNLKASEEHYTQEETSHHWYPTRVLIYLWNLVSGLFY
jgi:hypothetical protein